MENATENTTLQLQNSFTDEQLKLIQAKGLSWKALGEGAAEVEIGLIRDAEAAIKRISTLPTTIEEVAVAEVTLKNVSSEYLRIEESRSSVTKKFDALSTRFMAPSKSIQPFIVAYRNKIIEIKTAWEKSQLAVKEKAKEVINTKEYLANQVNAFDAACKTKILNLITTAYTYALGAGSIGTIDALKVYLDKVKLRLTAKDFIYNPTMPKLVYLNEQEYSELVEAISIPTDYVKLFIADLDKQFSDYETAWHNKEQALINQKKEAAEKEKATAEELANKNIAAKLEAKAVPAVAETGIKALKKSFQIDMVENDANAMIILGAFIANYTACSAKLRLKNAFNLAITNMIKSLEGLKNDDNAFEVTGIVWKEVSKI